MLDITVGMTAFKFELNKYYDVKTTWNHYGPDQFFFIRKSTCDLN